MTFLQRRGIVCVLFLSVLGCVYSLTCEKKDNVSLQRYVDGWERDVEYLKRDVDGLRRDVDGWKRYAECLKRDIDGWKRYVRVLKRDIEVLKHSQHRILFGEIARTALHRVCVTLKNRNQLRLPLKKKSVKIALQRLTHGHEVRIRISPPLILLF